MSRQHKLVSLIEALTNTAIGFGISYATWIFIVWTGWFDIHVSPAEGLAVTGIFTIISIARGYALRRVFVKYHEFLNRWL